MRLSQLQLLQLLQGNVVELRFTRRRDKPGSSPYRRMLCTNDTLLLNSAPGTLALHFRPPTQPPKYPWIVKNLVCTWDLFWQDWRMVPAESCNVITVVPTRPPEDFWKYFNVYLQSMSPSEKLQFMEH